MEFPELIPIVAERLAKNLRIRRNLPGGGRLRIDRQLPFLCVYRQPPNRVDAGTQSLVTTEAAYLFASGESRYHTGLAQLCRAIIQTLHEHFGAFLLLEVWARGEGESASPAIRPPEFKIHATEEMSQSPTVDVLKNALAEIRLHGIEPIVEVVTSSDGMAGELPPLFTTSDRTLSGFARVGLELQPVYRAVNGAVFPLLLRSLQRQLGPALRQTVFAFTGSNPQRQVPSYHSLGPSTMVKAARLVDQQLSEVAQSFDFILQTTPVNAEQAWRRFSASNFERVSRFRYRPLPYLPSTLKRLLFQVPIEHVEDVTLAQLFWEKQDELDRQLTALRDLNSSAFHYSSLQLYKKPSRELVDLALNLLSATPRKKDPHREREPQKRIPSRSRYATAQEVADQARQEIDYYHQRLSSFAGTVLIDDQIASGIMVAKEQVLIDPNLRIPRHRLLPLMHHEVGTHLLTYYNGRAQPLQQLYAGLAGYEPLQEGLAVLAEYLTGGLSPSRLRILAARVVAVHARIHGASFVDTFRMLHSQHDIPAKVAFTTTLRAFRGGGLTKDAIYLMGLQDLLAYLSKGHDIEPLYVGKIALEHIPIVQELRLRGIVQSPAILPRFWSGDTGARTRLEYCRKLTVLEMLTNDPPEFVPT